MGNFISFLQSIFLGKETETVRVGLSEFKKKTQTNIPSIKKKSIFIKKAPQELKLSELMRKGSY